MYVINENQVTIITNVSQIISLMNTFYRYQIRFSTCRMKYSQYSNGPNEIFPPYPLKICRSIFQTVCLFTKFRKRFQNYDMFRQAVIFSFHCDKNNASTITKIVHGIYQQFTTLKQRLCFVMVHTIRIPILLLEFEWYIPRDFELLPSRGNETMPTM